MNNINPLKMVIALILLVIIIVLVIAFVNPNDTDQDPPVTDEYSQTGNLTRNNPGLQPGVWYLISETSGQTVVAQQLTFTSSSRCVTDGTQSICNPEILTQGARAQVEGTVSDNVVTVETLTFVDAETPTENEDIRVTAPQANATVSSPLTVQGEARGGWYFEASFPVRLLDGDGNQIAIGIAQAQGEWMTENFVPFAAALTFTAPSTDTGTLVFEKANPSGLPENAEELRVPVRFNSANN